MKKRSSAQVQREILTELTRRGDAPDGARASVWQDDVSVVLLTKRGLTLSSRARWWALEKSPKEAATEAWDAVLGQLKAMPEPAETP